MKKIVDCCIDWMVCHTHGAGGRRGSISSAFDIQMYVKGWYQIEVRVTINLAQYCIYTIFQGPSVKYFSHTRF